MKFNKIKPKKISEVIYEQLKETILSGRLAPDERMPPERELASQLGVSRPSLREALHKLEAQGFLEQIQGDGTYVRSIAASGLNSAIEEFIKRDEAALDLIEIRKILETWAAKTAAERAGDAEKARMKDCLDEMQEALKKGEVGHISDVNFHYAISYGTKNVLLIHMMNTIYHWLEMVSYEVRVRMYQDEESFRKLFAQHQKIFDAISCADGQLAYDCMLEHMEYVEKRLVEIFRDKKRPATADL